MGDGVSAIGGKWRGGWGGGEKREMYLAVAKDGEVHDDAIDSVVGVCSENVFFEFVFGHFAKLELEAAGRGGVSQSVVV